MKHPLLIDLKACDDAREWAAKYPTLSEAWRNCERADWMLWLLARMVGKPGWPTHQTVARLACQCARTSLLKYVPAGEDRPRLAIEAAERWADSPTEENRRAAYAAHAAAAAFALRDMAAMIRETVPEIPESEETER